MTVDELYKQITKNQTPEQALKNILDANIKEYSHLKFSDDNNKIHPVVLINMASMELGWDVYLSYDDDNNIYGLFTGTEKYVNDVIGINDYFENDEEYIDIYYGQDIVNESNNTDINFKCDCDDFSDNCNCCDDDLLN